MSPDFAQRMFRLLSMDAAGMPLAEQTYDAYVAKGGEPDPMFESLRQAQPGTATFVKLQRELMQRYRQHLR
jgi:hypothetical protein